MFSPSAGVDTVAKKKAGSAKRYGTMVRIPDEAMETLRRTANFFGMSFGEYVKVHLVPLAEKQYQDAVTNEARSIEKKKRKDR